MRLQLEARAQILVNTDPQRRCYDGCHYSSELMWAEWDWIEWDVKPEDAEDRLVFWRELNAYSVSVGGSPKEYRIVEKASPEAD